MPVTKDIFFILIAFAAGMAMAVQGSMNSAVSRAIGLSQATFVVHFSATIIMVIILIFGISRGDWGNYSLIPWYYYLGGLIGVVITYTVVISIPKLGVAVATTAIIVGQVLTACMVDHFGFFGLERVPFTWLKFLGLIFLSIGAKMLLN
ncbi:MAG: bacterial/archaeal transporter family-2 protein [Tepidanaerobacteraceae bacterium]|nr:bacterial/archaeal transporter family-2 protein [Tepidanaerobacteraceae bacterium]